MYEIRIERVFHAAHALKLPDGSMEPMHAHDWQVFVHVISDQLNAMETVMDFHELQRIVDSAIVPLDQTTLNDEPAFATVNPSAERVAEHLYQAIAAQLSDEVKLNRVTVTEAPGCRASYWQ